MHVLGLLGMPRRVYTYHAGLGWDGLNLLASAGGLLFGAGTLLTLLAVAKARISGPAAGPDPWRADSLEWATSSPPPDYNFAAVPVVASRHPLWDERPVPVAVSGTDESTRALGVRGAEDRATPVTSGLDAAPEATMEVPPATYVPLLTALGVGLLFVALLIKAVLVLAIGLLVGLFAVLRWAWRTEEDLV